MLPIELLLRRTETSPTQPIYLCESKVMLYNGNLSCFNKEIIIKMLELLSDLIRHILRVFCRLSHGVFGVAAVANEGAMACIPINFNQKLSPAVILCTRLHFAKPIMLFFPFCSSFEFWYKLLQLCWQFYAIAAFFAVSIWVLHVWTLNIGKCE